MADSDSNSNPEDSTESQIDKMAAQKNLYVTTPEEKQLWKDCAREAFWRRSVPLSILLYGIVALRDMKKGANFPNYSANQRMGPLQKAMRPLYCITIGYFFGKISYIEECTRQFEEKLPNSNVSKKIREIRERRNPENYKTEIHSDSMLQQQKPDSIQQQARGPCPAYTM